MLGVAAATVGLFFLWGVLAPMNQWRVLTGWSVSDPHRHEPGVGSYGVRRLVSAVGAAGVLAVFVVAGISTVEELPKAPPPFTAVRVMWGTPDPQVVNRVVRSLQAPPVDLANQLILGYQAFDGAAPSYLTRLRNYSLLGNDDVPGYIGTIPDQGLAGVDTAQMLIHVRGPILCIPRAAVVLETETTIRVAIYYGLPDSSDGTAVDNAVSCRAGSTLTASLLVPITLTAPVGDRKVQTLDATNIPAVKIVSTPGE